MQRIYERQHLPQLHFQHEIVCDYHKEIVGREKITFLNVNRLVTYLNQVKYEVMLKKCIILAIAETFLGENVKDAVIVLEGFELLRIERYGREGRGVIIYYKQAFEPTELECFQVDSASNYIVNGEKLLFCLIYSPSKTPHSKNSFEQLQLSYSNIKLLQLYAVLFINELNSCFLFINILLLQVI